MVEADDLAAAELAYQRALAALHDARSQLSAVAAAQRRFAFDRGRLTPEAAADQWSQLEAAHTGLSARAGELREQAASLRDRLRRMAGDAGTEPEDLPEEPEGQGFQQPPFRQAP